MKSQVGARGRSEPGSDVGGGLDPGSPSQTDGALGANEAQVLECLAQAATGLTVAQLGARLECLSQDVQGSLDRLIELRLVTRLNTVVPSYARRLPTAGVHAE